jgi:hypothetical protein
LKKVGKILYYNRYSFIVVNFATMIPSVDHLGKGGDTGFPKIFTPRVEDNCMRLGTNHIDSIINDRYVFSVSQPPQRRAFVRNANRLSAPSGNWFNALSIRKRPSTTNGVAVHASWRRDPREHEIFANGEGFDSEEGEEESDDGNSMEDVLKECTAPKRVFQPMRQATRRVTSHISISFPNGSMSQRKHYRPAHEHYGPKGRRRQSVHHQNRGGKIARKSILAVSPIKFSPFDDPNRSPLPRARSFQSLPKMHRPTVHEQNMLAHKRLRRRGNAVKKQSYRGSLGGETFIVNDNKQVQRLIRSSYRII